MTSGAAPPPGRRLSLDEALALASKQAASNPAAAHKLLRRIVDQRPRHAEAWHRLGLSALRLGRLEEAATAFQAAVERAPAAPGYRSNLVEVLRRVGRRAEAVAVGRAGLALTPNHPGLLGNLGGALIDEGLAEEALPLLRRALALAPGRSQLLGALANALLRLGQYPEAFQRYAEAADRDKANAEVLSNWGLALRDEDHLAEARDRFQRALAIEPQHGNAGSMLAMLDLLEGDFARGWAGYETRWRSQGLRPRAMPMPPWQGEALTGASLYLHSEQGHGDTIQFVRYLPLLLERGVGELLCEVAPQLLGLLAQSFPGVTFVPRGTPPAATYHLPLMSLPLRFDTRLETIPAAVPYLTPAPECVVRWQQRLDALAPRDSLRVGLAWGGNTSHRADRLRSIGIAGLAPLRGIPGVRYFGLQFGERAPESAAWGDDLVNLGDELGDFANTAGALAALDLIITVDTATAHLAGAIGQETWVLLMRVPDWRWLLERGDSPWYPTARLFRQAAPRQWAPVAERVASELVASRDERLRKRRIP
jgi:tetratricopeptide (TPR) repeat protein